jgi:hypothetical protein
VGPGPAPLEVKVLERRLGHLRLAPQLHGTAELWRKFVVDHPDESAPDEDPAEGDPGYEVHGVAIGPVLDGIERPVLDGTGRWVAVRKRRRRRRWRASATGTTASLELIEVEVEGAQAWSVAIQARGRAVAGELRQIVRDVAAEVFTTWPESIPLGPPDSGSFAAWLQRRGRRPR